MQKYELTQNGHTYILSTLIKDQFVKLICVESGISGQHLFVAGFTLEQLRQLNSVFNNVSTIIEAQEIINQTIENQKVSVEPQGNLLNIVLFLSKETETDESYLIRMGLNSKGIIYKEPIIYKSVIQGPTSPTKKLPEKIISTKSETVAKSVYSPVQRLPDTHINLPPEETKTASPIYNNFENYENVQNYETNFQNYETNFQNYETNVQNYETNIQNNETNIQNYENIENYDNYNLNQENYNLYNVDTTTKTTTQEKLTLSLKSPYQTKNQDYNQYFNEYQTTEFQEYTPEATTVPYITPVVDQTYVPAASPIREQIQYEVPGSPSTAQITYSTAPSHHQQRIVETTKTTTTHYPSIQTSSIDMSVYNKKINELENETNKIRNEYNLMRSESSKLHGEIGQLRGQVSVLLEENRALRQKNNINPNEIQINEIRILKQENERLRKQLEQNMGIQTTFEQYKRLKEEEIRYLKLQIEELLKNQKKLEEIIKELKRQNEQLMKSVSISQTNLVQQKTKETLKNQSLTIQDTRMEVVKGDIIKTTEELELLTRKICNHFRKVTLDLLYKATVDSDKAAAFHNKCDWAGKTLVLIETTNGKRFGGYTTCSWKGDSIEKQDEKAFIFSLDKMETYNIIPGEYAIGCYPKYGPVFLGCQIRVYDDFFTRGGTTFEKGVNYDTQEDYELSGGLKQYDIKEIEVYSVQLE